MEQELTALEENTAVPINVLTEETVINTVPVEDEGAIAVDEGLLETETTSEEGDTELEGKVVKIDMPLAEVAIEDDAAVIPDITQLTLDSFILVDGEESAADLLTLGRPIGHARPAQYDGRRGSSQSSSEGAANADARSI